MKLDIVYMTILTLNVKQMMTRGYSKAHQRLKRKIYKNYNTKYRKRKKIFSLEKNLKTKQKIKNSET